MLDIQDFIKERGGDPDKIRKSQELRHADVGLVDKVIEAFEDHSMHSPEQKLLASSVRSTSRVSCIHG